MKPEPNNDERVARIEKMLFRAAANAETPEPLRGFEQRVLNRIATGARPDADFATVFARIAWRMIPALAALIVALAVWSFWPTQSNDLGLRELTAASEFETGWGDGLALSAVDNNGELR